MKYISSKTIITGVILLSSVSTTFAVTVKPLHSGGNAPLTNEHQKSIWLRNRF